jgi:hypothetical protein
MGPPDAPLGGCPEGREVRASREMVNQGRREHRLARAGQTRHAKTKGGLNELAGGLPERMRGRPGAGGEIVDDRHEDNLMLISRA